MKSLQIPIIEEKRVAQLYRIHTVNVNQQIRMLDGIDDLVLCGTTQGIYPVKFSDLTVGHRIAKSFSPVTSMDIRRDLKLIIHGEDNGTIASSIVEKRQLLRKFYGLLGRPFIVRFTPNGYHIIGSNGSGHVIIWDLGLGEAQFAAAVFKEQITSIEFIDQQTAAISSIDGSIAIIDILSTTIEPNISESKSRKATADYLLAKVQLENVVKINQIIYLGQNQFLVVCGDHLQILQFSKNFSQVNILARSQQVVHGIQKAYVYDESGVLIRNVYLSQKDENAISQEQQGTNYIKYSIYCGCNDGTIRRFYNGIQEHEILYSLRRNLIAFHCYDRSLFIVGLSGEQQLSIIAEQTQLGNDISVQKSALDKFKQHNKFLAAKEEFLKPRSGIDVVVHFNDAKTLPSEAASLLSKSNYAGALESSLFEGFEAVATVLRELEAIAGRSQELAIAGLSDQGVQTLILYTKDSLETDYFPVFMRALGLVVKLKESTLGQAIAFQLQDFRKELNEWKEIVTEGLNAFL